MNKIKLRFMIIALKFMAFILFRGYSSFKNTNDYLDLAQGLESVADLIDNAEEE